MTNLEALVPVLVHAVEWLGSLLETLLAGVMRDDSHKVSLKMCLNGISPLDLFNKHIFRETL